MCYTSVVPACALCGSAVPSARGDLPEAAGPPDFDTRPAEPLRTTIASWVLRCSACGYCAPDLAVASPSAGAVVQSDEYREILQDASLPEAARPFLAYASLLTKLHQHADAGWSALHAAWVCDDAGDDEAARRCRTRAIELWQRGKPLGQLFCDDMASEFALATDVYRRMGAFELATVACAEGLDLEDVQPAIQAVLRRQMVLIQQRDTTRHSMSELMQSARSEHQPVEQPLQ